MTMLRAGGLVGVLTALSDCRHETVEKIMERRISGVSYMCWIDFHNRIWGCGFLCARLVTLYFVSIFCLYFCVSLSGYHAEGYHVPSLPPRAITPVYTSRLPHQSYHAPLMHVHRVITPAISNSYFVVLSFTGFYATCTSPPTPPPGATRYNLLHTLASSIERVGRAFLGANEEK